MRFNDLQIKYFVIFCLVFTISNECNGSELNEKMQVTFLLKVLSYVKNINSVLSNTDKCIIGVLHKNSDNSNKIMNVLKSKISKKSKLKGVSIVMEDIEFKDMSSLESALLSKKINVLYIGKNTINEISNIIKLTQKFKILSVTGTNVENTVKAGITLGFGTQVQKELGGRKQKAKIYFNLKSSKSETWRFSSNFLRLAKVFK